MTGSGVVAGSGTRLDGARRALSRSRNSWTRYATMAAIGPTERLRMLRKTLISGPYGIQLRFGSYEFELASVRVVRRATVVPLAYFRGHAIGGTLNGSAILRAKWISSPSNVDQCR